LTSLRPVSSAQPIDKNVQDVHKTQPIDAKTKADMEVPTVEVECPTEQEIKDLEQGVNTKFAAMAEKIQKKQQKEELKTYCSQKQKSDDAAKAAQDKAKKGLAEPPGNELRHTPWMGGILPAFQSLCLTTLNLTTPPAHFHCHPSLSLLQRPSSCTHRVPLPAELARRTLSDKQNAPFSPLSRSTTQPPVSRMLRSIRTPCDFSTPS